jgi:hypothetical protein
MKYSIILVMMLSGCAMIDNNYSYYDTIKSVSKDITATQIACFNAMSEMSKDADSLVRAAAILALSRCRTPHNVPETPKQQNLTL